jgi:hypothetical protein
VVIIKNDGDLSDRWIDNSMAAVTLVWTDIQGYPARRQRFSKSLVEMENVEL